MKKAIVYMNQFFGQVGGEDKADFEPVIKDGPVGPALEMAKELKAEIINTVICGDNFMGSNTDEAVARILAMLEGKEFDVFIAGPAFQAGRYGFACGTIAKAVQAKFNVPIVTSMHEENPGVEMFRSDMHIMKGSHSAGSMRKDVSGMVSLANKFLTGEELNCAEEEGHFGRGIRKQVWLKDGKPSAERMIDMLVKKLNDEPYQTELPIKIAEKVPVAPPIKDLSKANIAVVTCGGIVPVDNPDRIQSASATKWGRYDIGKLDALKGGEFKTIHSGFDPTAANADPHVIVPLDTLRALEKEQVFGRLHPYFYSTVGTGTTQAEAKRMAEEMLPFLKEDGVDAVFLVAT